MRAIAGLLAVLGSTAWGARAARADEPPAPAVLALVDRANAGAAPVTLARFAPDGARHDVLAGLPSGTYGLAVHAATGRWALTFHQLSEGAPLVIGGAEVSRPDDRATLVLGDGDRVVATTLGDPACTSARVVCFERPVRFSPDGSYVFVESEAPRWISWGRWSFGARPARAAIADRRTAVALAVDDATGRAVYQGKGGAVFVTAWPAVTAKPRKLTAARRAALTVPLLMSAVVPTGDLLVYFRRDADQAHGVWEAWSVTTRAVVAAQPAAAEYPLPRGAIVPVPARGTAVFVDDTGFERGTLWELGAGGATALAADVRQVLAVSGDGRFVLATRRLAPARGNAVDNPERLIVIDTVAHAERAIDLGAGAAVTAAGFVP